MTDTTPQGIRVRIDERAGGARIAHVTIDNARRLNSLNSALMTEFIGAIETLAAIEGLRAVVLTGAGSKASSAARTSARWRR
jgi:enoyl-CoA hydratase/carnithine racemase